MSKDIATHSYIQAFEKISSYDKNKSRFSTWLFTIAKNHTFNELKYNKRYIIEEFSEIDNKEETYLEDISINDKFNFVKENIENLKYPYNIVMNMILLENKTYNDVSEYFNDKNLNTIKSWIRKGKNLLRELVEEKFNLKK